MYPQRKPDDLSARARQISCQKCRTGTGRVGKALTAPDVAKGTRRIDYARSRRSGEQPLFEVGDACALPYADGQFGGTATQFVLMFIPRPELALREIRRVTRRGGRVGAALWDLRGGLVFERVLWDTAVGIDPEARAVRDWRFNAPPVLPDGLPRLFRDAQLEDVERASLTVRTDFARPKFIGSLSRVARAQLGSILGGFPPT